MIYDMAAFIGAYERRPVGLSAAELAGMLAPWGVSKVFAGRIDGLRYENSHQAEVPLKPETYGAVEVEYVPVIDPTIATWEEAANRYDEARGMQLGLIRLHPNYHGYSVKDQGVMGPVVEWAHHRGVVIQVVVSVDDLRRQHAQGQVKDVPIVEIMEIAKAFPHQSFLVSGVVFGQLAGLGKDRPGNLWSDTARVEAGDGLKLLVERGWEDRLVCGSHVPILIPYSAVARVLADLPDDKAEKILWGNAKKLLQKV